MGGVAAACPRAVPPTVEIEEVRALADSQTVKQGSTERVPGAWATFAKAGASYWPLQWRLYSLALSGAGLGACFLVVWLVAPSRTTVAGPIVLLGTAPVIGCAAWLLDRRSRRAPLPDQPSRRPHPKRR